MLGGVTTHCGCTIHTHLYRCQVARLCVKGQRHDAIGDGPSVAWLDIAHLALRGNTGRGSCGVASQEDLCGLAKAT